MINIVMILLQHRSQGRLTGMTGAGQENNILLQDFSGLRCEINGGHTEPATGCRSHGMPPYWLRIGS